MKKKTIKDVAKLADVSVATVSYVINNRTDQKISDATRKKVLQVVNVLNYTPNTSAQNLSTRKNPFIGVLMPVSDTPLAAADAVSFINALSDACRSSKYSLVYLPPETLQPCNQVAAILCCNYDKERFAKVADENMIPVIAVDCLIGDALFYQISIDLAALKQRAVERFGETFTFVSLDFNNRLFKERILSHFPGAVFVRSFSELSTLAEKTCNLVLVHRVLYDFFTPLGFPVLFENLHSDKKFQKIVECVENAVGRKSDCEHDVLF